MQRFASERFFLGVERVTVYSHQRDKAIGAADWLFASRQRVGRAVPGDLTANQRRTYDMLPWTHMISVRVKTDYEGHYYFLQSPAVSSDLILLLRDNRDPGRENGRPLIKRDANYWELVEGYPHAKEE